jgi:hypothetical protein
MKKKGLNLKKLAIRKETIAELHADTMGNIAGGGSQASACHSCMSQCLCTPPPSGNLPCCPAPPTMLCATQDQQEPL